MKDRRKRRGSSNCFEFTDKILKIWFFRIERKYEDPSIANAQTVFVGNVPSGCTQKVFRSIRYCNRVLEHLFH